MAQEEIIFPNNIRNIRASKGMKMTELARRANLSLSAVSKIEKGVRRLNQKQLLNVCTILGCKLSDIFIHESDSVAQNWQNEIKRRLNDNEDSGLKIFGSGLPCLFLAIIISALLRTLSKRFCQFCIDCSDAVPDNFLSGERPSR